MDKFEEGDIVAYVNESWVVDIKNVYRVEKVSSESYILYDFNKNKTFPMIKGIIEACYEVIDNFKPDTTDTTDSFENYYDEQI